MHERESAINGGQSRSCTFLAIFSVTRTPPSYCLEYCYVSLYVHSLCSYRHQCWSALWPLVYYTKKKIILHKQRATDNLVSSPHFYSLERPSRGSFGCRLVLHIALTDNTFYTDPRKLFSWILVDNHKNESVKPHGR